MSHKARQKGFTIVELMLAMAFLAFMLVFVFTATTQIMRAYNKGLTIKQINQTGRSLVDDIQRTAANASKDSLKIANANGRLCVGGVTYVWNKLGASANVVSTTPVTVIDLIKVADPTANYCTNPTQAISASSTWSRLSDNSARILNLEAKPLDNGQLLYIKAWFGTNSAGNQPVAVGSDYKCEQSSNALYGTFCAVADFETTVYLKEK